MSNWETYAKCAKTDTNPFFPNEKDLQAVKAVKRFCRTCPVKQECLDFAIENKLEYGIWGGKTYAERIVVQAILPAISVSSDRAERIQPKLLEQTFQSSSYTEASSLALSSHSTTPVLRPLTATLSPEPYQQAAVVSGNLPSLL